MEGMDKGQDTWDRVITPKGSLLDLRLGELWAYRYLIKMFVRRDFAAAYKQTILGPLWFIIPPLLSSFTFTIIFGRIAQLSTDGQPQFLFYMTGIIIWGHFSATVLGNSAIFSAQAALFSKVYFPRLIVPVTNFLSGMIHFAVQLAILIVFLVYSLLVGSDVRPQWTIALLPFLVIISGFLGLSAGIIASALTTRYRDLSFLVNFGMSLWMYATPVIYPLSSVPEEHRWLILLNPMSAVVATFRHAVLGAGYLPMWGLTYSVGFAIIALIVAVVIFNRIERVAMDTI
jgi:lipopolysaccharide transport system permease protein